MTSSITADYRDARSATVPALRHKSHRKRYKHVNAALIGSLASQFTTPGISAHMHERVVWNNRNKFKMPSRYPSTPGQSTSQSSGAPRLNRKFLQEEIQRAHEPDALTEPLDSSSGSDYDDADEGTGYEFGGFENRGELVWDALIKGAEEKFEEGVFRKEWEVVEEEREEVVKEVDGFELV